MSLLDYCKILERFKAISDFHVTKLSSWSSTLMDNWPTARETSLFFYFLFAATNVHEALDQSDNTFKPGWKYIFRMNQIKLESDIRKVSRDLTLEPRRKDYLIQNIMTSRWIAAQQKLPQARTGEASEGVTRDQYTADRYFIDGFAMSVLYAKTNLTIKIRRVLLMEWKVQDKVDADVNKIKENWNLTWIHRLFGVRHLCKDFLFLCITCKLLFHVLVLF
ncbi:hypothetical protein POM88_044917 [Heracleum sosnowskyi]|uniref:Uncharacterized protein n=1 Tax=Heracleum sosnowskyi TaxID=360622 RepID=A0AAD8H5F7_9APIA|nr:hypothetical protein POM88_044917 [Heracleum sosnowskyi]